jgi:hypothetical protein
MILRMTDQIRLAIESQNGVPLQMVDEATQRVYYVVASEQFEALCASVDPFTPRDLYPLIAKSAAASGWNDPIMDEYDNYDENRNKSQAG